jgi:hypothetical protein
MKWTGNDIDAYLQAKDYVDTAIIPLVPIDWETELKSSVVMGEYITLLSEGLEREYRGRVILFPPYTYLKMEPTELKLKRLKDWETMLQSNGFKHVIHLTSDVEWRSHENEINSLIWMPAIPVSDMSADHKFSIVSDQIKQMMKIILEEWKKQA